MVSETRTTKGLVAADATESAFCPQTMITSVGGPSLDAERFGRRRVGRWDGHRGAGGSSGGRAGSPGPESSRVSRS